jgi:hypothetical protein
MAGQGSSNVGADGLRVFADQATRDARLPNPLIGQVCVLVDTGGLCIYYGPALGWRKPWNSAWGEIARTVDSTAEAFFNDQGEHEVPGLLTSFTVVAGRKYRITLKAALGTNDTLNIGQGYVRFRDEWAGSSLSLTVEFAHRIWMPSGLSAIQVAFESEVGTLSPGAHKLHVTTKSDQTAGLNISTGDGGINIAAEPAILTIDDVGPAANPNYG